MFLRQLRWMAAGLAALAVVLAAPARSSADVQVLVEELDGGGTVVASQFTTGTGNLVFYSFTGVHFSGGGSVTSVSGTSSSITPSFSGFFTQNFDPAQDHKIRITVTNDGFTTTPDGSFLKNDSGASQAGLADGNITVTTFSRIYNPGAPGAIPASSTTQLADGLTTAGPTPVSSVTGAGVGATTSVPAGALSSPYAIQQQILISFDGSISPDGTFGATGGARVDPAAPVPAPGGLALALVGLPLIGLRRALRNRAAA